MDERAGQLLWHARARALEARATAPSFVTKNEQMRRVRRIGWQLGVEEPVWSVNDKRDTYAWVDRMGIRRPAELARAVKVAALGWTDLPDRIVLKPERGAGGHGIRLLERRDGTWFDLIGEVSVDVDELDRAHASLVDGGRVSAEVFAEEMVRDPQRPGGAPVDWKVYAFFGTVGMIAGRARSVASDNGPRSRFRVFDASWRDFGPDVTRYRYDPGIAPPRHAEEVLDVARRVSAAIPRAFVRVDLYDDEHGVVFGELTPEPGGPQRFRRDVDRRLGELWEEAEGRVQAYLASTGLLRPALQPLPHSAVVQPLSPGAVRPAYPSYADDSS